MQITATLDDRELKRAVAVFGPRLGGGMAKALNRTAFELRDAERAEATEDFNLRRLRPNFRFDAATATRLEAVFMPLPITERFVAQHVSGGSVTPSEGPSRLEVGGEFAVPLPTAEARAFGLVLGARGRIPERLAPGTLLRTRRGFIAPLEGILFGRKGGRGAFAHGSKRNIALYALVPKIELKPIYPYFTTARETVEHWLPIKAREEWGKLRA